MSKWKCTICGEIIESNETPEKCPVCGVGAKYFVKVEEEKDQAKEFADVHKIVIIGASGAGMSAAEEIRKRNNKF